MLQLTSVVKSFGALRAIDDVTLAVAPGEIVGLVGENGAGKTTLMRIVAGELAADSGNVSAPSRVELVHQHFMLVGDFTIAENLVLASSRPRAWLSPRRVLRAATEIVTATGLALGDLDRRVDGLSVGERARIELVKALARRPELLILDEPTSVLTSLESEQLFDVIRRVAAGGTTVVFISHKVPEVLALAERVVVMRAGRVVADSRGGMRPQEIADAMVGSRTPPVARPQRAARESALSVARLATDQLHDLDLEVQRGEIVAIAGVAGNGQAELASVLRGLTPFRGSVLIAGEGQTARDLFRSRSVGHIPEDRTRDALVSEMSIAENIALTSRRWRRGEASRTAERLIGLYTIRARSAAQPARELSGGNQQKVILARELDRRPSLIVAAEPTRGLDVAAANFVHDQLRAAAAAGAAILLITSDLDEAFAISDALHVIYRGTLTERLTMDQASERVAGLMAGVT